VLLGNDPEAGLPVSLRKGPYGTYVQLGEANGDDKPKRSSLPKGLAPADVDLAKALALLNLPREIGAHPDTGEPITAGIGRFGPYVRHGTAYKTIPGDEDVLTIGMNRAVALLAEAKGAGRRQPVKPLRGLGAHPADGQPVEVYEGRYGPYVKHGRTNATLPRELEPGTVTLEQALPLIEAKGGKSATAKPRGKAAAAKATRSRKANGAAADGRPAAETAAGKPAAKRPARKAKGKKPAAKGAAKATTSGPPAVPRRKVAAPGDEE
jgi:DNA topoisomerase-1